MATLKWRAKCFSGLRSLDTMNQTDGNKGIRFCAVSPQRHSWRVARLYTPKIMQFWSSVLKMCRNCWTQRPPPLPHASKCEVFPISQVLGFKHTEPRNTAVIEAIMRWATLSWNTSIQLPVWIILCLCIHAIMDFYCPIIHQLHRISITRITAQMRVCDMRQDPIHVFFFFFNNCPNHLTLLLSVCCEHINCM